MNTENTNTEIAHLAASQAEAASDVKAVTQPPFGSLRAAALALYVPPFRFQHGYIFDAANKMVADDGGFGEQSVETHIAARVRGWGRIGYMPNAAALQDEVGAMLAEALTTFWTRAAS